MDEFGAELDGNGQAGHVERPDTAADAVTRLEDECRLPGTGELRGRCQPGGASTQNHYVVGQGMGNSLKDEGGRMKDDLRPTTRKLPVAP